MRKMGQAWPNSDIWRGKRRLTLWPVESRNNWRNSLL